MGMRLMKVSQTQRWALIQVCAQGANQFFQAMKRQGSSLKRAKRINPVPRRADMDHYRDVKAQNDWLHSCKHL